MWFHAITGQLISEIPAGVLRVEGLDGPDGLIGPALFDPQVNGFVGVDFQSPFITLDELEYASEALARCGCSHYLITIITDGADALTDQFRRLADLLDRSPAASRRVLGFHLEGPFISATPGFVGAHPIKHTCDPSWELFEKFQKASGNRIRLLTLDPERRGSMEFIRKAAASGVWVSCGHADPSLETLWAAAEAGAKLFTHLSNGCPVTLPRHDNIIQRVLAVPELQVLMIPDGIHVPPPALGNFAKAVGPSRLIFTTDAATPAGGPPGHYRFGPIELEIGDDRVVRLPGSPNLAGSSLTPIEGFYNAIRIGGMGAAAAWHAWTRLRTKMFPEIEPPLLALPFPRPAPVMDRKFQKTE
ncbi:MAG: N-acetylglucosamine-6-phosphate deacetylase [Candidatus Sumerlaeia bacterium]